MIEGRVAALNVYPIKGARGVAADSVRAECTGLSLVGAADREWMLVDPRGVFVTQRECPRLALISIEVKPGTLVVSAPGKAPLELSLSGPRGAGGSVTVWHASVQGLDEGERVAAWFTEFLGRRVRVVRFDRSKVRRCNPDYVGASGAHTLFADAYPVLVIGDASLADLNARIVARGSCALPMNRFRPNIVVSGLDPYAEDHVDLLETSEVSLKLVKPCTRCQVTTTDQATGRVGGEPLPTLAGYRRDDRLGGVTFGMNAIVVREGRIARDEAFRASYRF